MNVHKATTGGEPGHFENPDEVDDHPIKHQLLNIKKETAAQVIEQIKAGGKFIVFYYRLAILAVSYQRLSPAIFIRNQEEFEFYRKKYNKMALLKGFLYFPFGPLPALKEIKLNNKGGLDVTGDILLNLNETDLNNEVVYIRQMHTLFGHVAKTDLKYFKKTLLKYAQSNPEIECITVGTYINVNQHEEPPFCIGVAIKEKEHTQFEEVEKFLYKEFRSFNHFIHFDLNAQGEDAEISKKFKSQGQVIYDG